MLAAEDLEEVQSGQEADDALPALFAGAGGDVVDDVFRRFQHIDEHSVRRELAEIVKELVVGVAGFYLLIDRLAQRVGEVFASSADVFVGGEGFDEVRDDGALAGKIGKQRVARKALI